MGLSQCLPSTMVRKIFYLIYDYMVIKIKLIIIINKVSKIAEI